MTRVDPVADALISIKNSENVAKEECMIKPASKLIGEILKVMQKHGYVGLYEYVDDGREGMYKIKLKGAINECMAVKPRYAVKRTGFEKYEKRYLPSKELGIMIVSTPKGVMSHREAESNGVGGRILAFVF